jgi:hypothetical protein
MNLWILVKGLKNDDDHQIIQSKSPLFDPSGRMAGFCVFRGEKSLIFEDSEVQNSESTTVVDLGEGYLNR